MCENINMSKMTNIQKEVWKNVETYTDLIFQGRFDEFLNYLHKDYSGWDYMSDEPTCKKTIAEEIKTSHTNVNKLLYKIRPAEIKIFGQTAIVHYYFSLINESVRANDDNIENHYTDILIKQNEKWVLIGDHVSKINFETWESRFLSNS